MAKKVMHDPKARKQKMTNEKVAKISRFRK